MDSVLDLPFDQYQRYRLVSDLLNEVRAPGEKLAILDVGGRTALLRSFLAPDAITLVDMEAAPHSGLVLGDGSRLPFASKSFDVVTAFDTLEHVPVARRAAFVAECARVARRYVVLAGPYQAQEVEQAEVLLQRFLRDKLGVEHRYLEEHRHYGLPLRAQTEAALATAGGRVTSIGHGNLERWLALMCAALYLDHDPALRPLAASIFRFYNANLYASDHASPVYRHAVVAAFEGARLPTGAPGLDLPRAPAGTLEQFQDVLGELAAFDRARSHWHVERERMWETVATLRTDLAGHHATLHEQRELARQSAEVIATLQADLGEHRVTLAARGGRIEVLAGELAHTQGEVVRARSALDRAAEAAAVESARLRAERDETSNALDQARDHVAAHERDLAGHRVVVAELRGQLSTLRTGLAGLEAEREALRAECTRLASELTAARAVVADREADLAEHRRVVSAVTADLAGQRTHASELRGRIGILDAALASEQRGRGEAQAEIARLAESLSVHDAKVSQLRGLLAGRWKNLRRALGPGRPTP